MRIRSGRISLDLQSRFCYYEDVMGVDVMLDPIFRNSLDIRSLGACPPSVRPRLGAAVRESEVVPVQVHVRLVRDEVLVPPEAVAHSRRPCDPLPIGTTLDCYV